MNLLQNKLLNITEYYWILLNITGYYWILNITEFFKSLNIQMRGLLNIQLLQVSLTVLTASEFIFPGNIHWQWIYLPRLKCPWIVVDGWCGGVVRSVVATSMHMNFHVNMSTYGTCMSVRTICGIYSSSLFTWEVYIPR